MKIKLKTKTIFAFVSLKISEKNIENFFLKKKHSTLLIFFIFNNFEKSDLDWLR